MGEPVFGRLFAGEALSSGATLSATLYPALAIEGELAVRLAKDVAGSLLSREEVGGAIVSVFPVIELHRNSLRADRLPGPQLIASNAIHAGFVAGESETPFPVSVGPSDHLRVIANGEELGSVGLSTAIGEIAGSLCWLSSKLADFGLSLLEGQIVLTGSPLRLFPVTAARESL